MGVSMAAGAVGRGIATGAQAAGRGIAKGAQAVGQGIYGGIQGFGRGLQSGLGQVDTGATLAQQPQLQTLFGGSGVTTPALGDVASGGYGFGPTSVYPSGAGAGQVPALGQPGASVLGAGVEAQGFWEQVGNYVSSEEGRDVLGGLAAGGGPSGYSETTYGPIRHQAIPVGQGLNPGLQGLGQLASSF